VEGTSLVDMIKEDLVAERIAIDSYNEIIRYLADNDPTSRRVMEEVLAKEEEHTEDMKTLIDQVSRAEEQNQPSLRSTPPAA
jgi:bacterioferritin